MRFRAAVRRAFEAPGTRAVPEWEPLAATRDRLLPAVRRILDAHPDTDAWAALRMPDLWVVGHPEHAGATE